MVKCYLYSLSLIGRFAAWRYDALFVVAWLAVMIHFVHEHPKGTGAP